MFSYYNKVFVLLTAVSTAFAVPGVTSLPGEKKCSPTTTLTTTSTLTTPLICNCPLETPCTPPAVATTSPLPTTTLLEGCTLEVIVGPPNCGQACSFCATPTPLAHKRLPDTAPTSLPGHKVCSPTTTITTTSTYSEPCSCPIETPCSAGSIQVPSPLPTTTLIEGCVEEVIVGPGCGCLYCEADS